MAKVVFVETNSISELERCDSSSCMSVDEEVPPVNTVPTPEVVNQGNFGIGIFNVSLVKVMHAHKTLEVLECCSRVTQRIFVCNNMIDNRL